MSCLFAIADNLEILFVVFIGFILQGTIICYLSKLNRQLKEAAPLLKTNTRDIALSVEEVKHTLAKSTAIVVSKLDEIIAVKEITNIMLGPSRHVQPESKEPTIGVK